MPRKSHRALRDARRAKTPEPKPLNTRRIRLEFTREQVAVLMATPVQW